MDLKQKDINRLEELGYTVPLIQKLQVKGGCKFETLSKYTNTGTGYVACITVTELSEEVPYRWLSYFMSNSRSISTTDINNANTAEVLKMLNASMSELGYQAENERSRTDKRKAMFDEQNLLHLADNLSLYGEIVKNVTIRIFVYDEILELLEKRIKEIRTDLESMNHKTTVQLNRSKNNFMSLFEDMDIQQSKTGKTKPIVLPAFNIGAGIPFHYNSLKDEHGFYLGQTSTGGAFIFDPFCVSKTRMSFNGFILGTMGAGKSTFVKMLLEGLFARRAYVRAFDKSGEYKNLCKYLGGVYIDLSGSKSRINPLQVIGTNVNDETFEIDQKSSFQTHLKRCATQLKFLLPSIDDNTLSVFKSLLIDFYEDLNMIPKSWLASEEEDDCLICSLSSEDYPIYSDFYNYICKKQNEKIDSDKLKNIEKLKIPIEKMIKEFPQTFNGITTLPDLSRISLVVYDISRLSDTDEDLMKAQIFTSLTTIWNQAVTNGKRMKHLEKMGEISKNKVRHFELLLDECHNILNPNNVESCRYIVTFEREMRKFKAGVFFATQSPQELISDNNSEATDIIKQIFELCTYKVFMKMDDSVLNGLQTVVGNSLSTRMLQRIPDLEKGQALFQVSNANTMQVNFDPDNAQLERFEGGS